MMYGMGVRDMVISSYRVHTSQVQALLQDTWHPLNNG
jgi:hypothetical protein